jgi:predicted nucleic acid-binding protein
MVARAEWIKVKRVSELGVAILATELDLGEAEAIILAKSSMPSCCFLMRRYLASWQNRWA